MQAEARLETANLADQMMVEEWFSSVDTATISTDLSFDDRVDIIEAYIRRFLNGIDIPPVHRFASGLYSREVTIPAGTLLTGKIHKHEHICIISSGSIMVWSEERGPEMVTAPFTYISRPGARRVGFTLEDTTWTTVHSNPTDTTDIDQIERELYAYREPIELDSELVAQLTQLTGGVECLES